MQGSDMLLDFSRDSDFLSHADKAEGSKLIKILFMLHLEGKYTLLKRIMHVIQQTIHYYYIYIVDCLKKYLKHHFSHLKYFNNTVNELN